MVTVAGNPKMTTYFSLVRRAIKLPHTVPAGPTKTNEPCIAGRLILTQNWWANNRRSSLEKKIPDTGDVPENDINARLPLISPVLRGTLLSLNIM